MIEVSSSNIIWFAYCTYSWN